jgi:hypothetical protein|tara:strand:- start:677 stop:835 length:159 start_codon:yes stop_codon:yes gene_type:complete
MSVLEILGLASGLLILSLIFIFAVAVAIVTVYGCCCDIVEGKFLVVPTEDDS